MIVITTELKYSNSLQLNLVFFLLYKLKLIFLWKRFYRSMHIVQATTVLFLRERSLQILNSAKLSILAASDFKNDELYSSTSVVRSKFRLKFIDEIYNRKSTLNFSSNENEFYDKQMQYFASISKYTMTYFNDYTLENQIWQAVDQPLSRDYYTFLPIESQENAFKENVKLLGTCFPVDGEIENLPSWTNSRSSSSGQMYDKMYRQAEDDAHSDVAYYQLHALKSYLQTCVACGMVGRAYQTLIRYVYPKTQKNRSARLKFNDPELYNIVLLGLVSSKQPSLAKIEHVLYVMDAKRVRADLKTVACLALLGQTDRALQLAEKYDLAVEEILSRHYFPLAQRVQIVEEIRRQLPEFKPARCKEMGRVLQPYSCKLLAELNQPRADDHNDYQSPYEKLFNRQWLLSAFRRQLKLELDGRIRITSVAGRQRRKSAQLEKAAYLYEQCLTDLQKCWRRQLHRAILAEKLKLSRAMRHTRAMNIEPFLNCVSSKEVADLICDEIDQLCTMSSEYSEPFWYYCERLADRLMKRFHINYRQQQDVFKTTEKIYTKYADYFLDASVSKNYNHRQFWNLNACQLQPEYPSVDMPLLDWAYADKLEIGRQLFALIFKEVLLPRTLTISNGELKKGELVPAFYTVFCDSGSKSQEELRLHPTLINLMRFVHPTHIVFHPLSLPMLCPPVPWHVTKTGYFLVNQIPLIRLNQNALPSNVKQKEIAVDDALPAMDCLNQLASTPWKINVPVLDVMLTVFQGEGDERLSIAPPPWLMPPNPKMPRGGTREMGEYFRKRYELKKLKNENYSLWCSLLYKLTIANHFRNDIIWFPHNLDFRGRVYPCPPHFNHMGDDVCRGLLLFAKGQPLGEKGLDWLKVHLINLTGIMKHETFAARLAFANSIIEDILDSAAKPLTGRRWWTLSEEPWQTLACCMEIAAAINCPDGCENFQSHFPVHQDGSCNGLQHYAALGRDREGAFQVNLCQDDRPQDVYSGVAQLVEKKRVEDAKNGNEIAIQLDGIVKRKVVKQTVMTTVYGVTQFGARQQISKQLKALDSLPDDVQFQASKYLMRKTFDSLGQMFAKAKRIQDWLAELSSLVAKDCQSAMSWRTPLQFPVVQPYYKPARVAASVLGDYSDDVCRRAVYNRCSSTGRPDSRKQRNGFPPNFIHSLDSSHMMLTSLYCQRDGLTYASVHDCYWTHASTVDAMAHILRQQFVRLHSEPVLKQLSEYLISSFLLDRYNNSCPDDKANEKRKYLLERFQDVPAAGDFDIVEVLKSKYFFS
ncbi:DNA-directed RNA polymerase, mitochondrial [Trichinella nelsoni]|uniref:DNA-directed RNA polymerase n=1 Tax=Trichinella nelsoni TaxID=6336 RepID=A0A0V0SFA9_9BILA|nr:DNA-directed RNA polymerase, mitochondrial [Trichinella nelsoni]